MIDYAEWKSQIPKPHSFYFHLHTILEVTKQQIEYVNKCLPGLGMLMGEARKEVGAVLKGQLEGYLKVMKLSCIKVYTQSCIPPNAAHRVMD